MFLSQWLMVTKIVAASLVPTIVDYPTPEEFFIVFDGTNTLVSYGGSKAHSSNVAIYHDGYQHEMGNAYPVVLSEPGDYKARVDICGEKYLTDAVSVSGVSPSPLIESSYIYRFVVTAAPPTSTDIDITEIFGVTDMDGTSKTISSQNILLYGSVNLGGGAQPNITAESILTDGTLQAPYVQWSSPSINSIIFQLTLPYKAKTISLAFNGTYAVPTFDILENGRTISFSVTANDNAATSEFVRTYTNLTPYPDAPQLTYQKHNKLTVHNTSETTLRLEANTWNIATAGNIWINKSGNYKSFTVDADGQLAYFGNATVSDLTETFGDVPSASIFSSTPSGSGFFGTSVSISGDLLIVGGSSTSVSGHADIFIRSLSQWTHEYKIIPSDGAAGDGFGKSVAIHGDYAIVGRSSYNSNRGAAYIFKRDATSSPPSWAQEYKFELSPGVSGDQFGHSVAIHGDYAIVGAYTSHGFKGSAYIYERDATSSPPSWAQRANLQSQTPTLGDVFGFSVAIHGDYAIVGYPAPTEAYRGGPTDGAADIFKRDATSSPPSWAREATIVSGLTSNNQAFGSSVAISDDTVIVGARYTNTNMGAAYIFKRDATSTPPSWSQEANIQNPTSRSAVEYFGQSVGIDGNHAIIGSKFAGIETDPIYFGYHGATYFYKKIGSSWHKISKIYGGGIWDQSGFDVSIDGDYAAVGVPFYDDITVNPPSWNVGTVNIHSIEKPIISTPAPGTLAFHHGNFTATDYSSANATVEAAAANGYLYADTPTGVYIWGTLVSRTLNTNTTSVYEWTLSQPITCENLLLVAGGGSGGSNSNYRGGAGGAGGLIHLENYSLPSGTYTVTVGNGGLGFDSTLNIAPNGFNTVITGEGRTITALGGGGSLATDGSSGTNPSDGGSGGGGWYTTGTKFFGLATQPSTTSDGISTYAGTGYGNNGGSGSTSSPYGGGGGGAGAVGENAVAYINSSPLSAPDGGDGLDLSSVFGTYGDTNYPGWFAGGGSADGYEASFNTTAGTPGKGGGGVGNNDPNANTGVAGQKHTGGGGGSSTSGGSGVVLISSVPNITLTDATPSLTYDGYNRLAVVGAVNKTLYKDSNSWNVGTASNLYITEPGEYTYLTRDTSTAFLANVTVGAVSQHPTDVAPSLAYDGVTNLKIIGAYPLSHITYRAYDSNKLLACGTDLTTYPLYTAGGNYKAEISGSATFTLTSNVTVPAGELIPLYKYPPVGGTTSSLTTSTSPATPSDWTITGADYGNGEYFARSNIYSSGDRSVYKMFDNNFGSSDGFESDITLSPVATTGTFRVDIPSPVTIHKYVVWPKAEDGKRPKSWTIEGSHNGTLWATLHTVTNSPPSLSGDAHEITSPAAHAYYRINVTANNGGAGLEIIELALYGDVAFSITFSDGWVTTTGSTSVAVGASYALPTYTTSVPVTVTGAGDFDVFVVGTYRVVYTYISGDGLVRRVVRNFVVA